MKKMYVWDGSGTREKEVFCKPITDSRVKAFVAIHGSNASARIELQHSTDYHNDIGSDRNDFDQVLILELYEAEFLGEVLLRAAEAARASLKDERQRCTD